MPNSTTLRRFVKEVNQAAKNLDSKATVIGEKIPSKAMKGGKVTKVTNQMLKDADEQIGRIAKLSRALADELERNAEIAEDYERKLRE